MKYLLLLVSVIGSSAIAAENQATICKHGEKVRKIEVVYPEGTEAPCEVQYTKDTGTQVLWNAKTEMGYCEEKAAAFIEKQRGWGWQCEAVEQVESQETETQEVTPQEETAEETETQKVTTQEESTEETEIQDATPQQELIEETEIK